MRFTESHEWIRINQNVGTVGITLYAQKELGEVVYIELPHLNQQVKAGEELCVLESTKAAADIYSPVSGTIIAVNERLRQNSTLINQLPESDGWLFQIELSHPKELDRLLTTDQYQKMIL